MVVASKSSRDASNSSPIKVQRFCPASNEHLGVQRGRRLFVGSFNCPLLRAAAFGEQIPSLHIPCTLPLCLLFSLVKRPLPFHKTKSTIANSQFRKYRYVCYGQPELGNWGLPFWDRKGSKAVLSEGAKGRSKGA